jgi:23S rRNA pseudoU1915 N3-methylase RlmH
MTDRTVKVSLIAQVTGYIQGMEKAAAATKATGTEAEKLAQKKEAFNQLGNAALAMGAVAAAGVAIAIKKFADWDAQMSQVQTLSHATADDMDKLRDAP